VYLWKLWREGWTRLALCFAIGAVWVVAVRWTAHVAVQRGVGLTGGAVAAARSMWLDASRLVDPIVAVSTILAAVLMVEIAAGNEFAQGTAEFLLTRARPRRHYVWAGWSFGMLQLLLLPLVIVGCEMGALVSMTGTFESWRPFAVCALLAPTVAIVYGAGYLLCVVLRNGQHSVVAVLVGIVIYLSAPFALSQLSDMRFVWPDWWFHNLVGWAWQRRPTPFPLVPVVGWTLFALLFPALAQWRLERMEL
jgi:hypothetical protein